MAREPDDLVRFEQDLSAFLDGELDSEREAQLRAALVRSPALVARLEALRAVDAGLRTLPAPTLPADLHARLRARTAEATPPAATRAAPARRAPWRLRSAPALAAAAVAAALAWVLLLSQPVDELPEERVAEAPPAPVPVPDAPPAPAPVPVPAAPRAPAPPQPEALAEVDLETASDEELALAMDWELLQELELLERLELLEAMVELEARGRG